jgi:hypothetical protein
MNHIILDMDGTLVGIVNNMKPISRPYLEDFLVFCFKNFKSVSIWTAANIEWFEVVNEKIFQPMLEKHNLNFRFVWDYNKCIRTRTINYYGFKYIKNLEKVWNEYKDMNKDNTIIVDDNQISCMDNLENAIIIPSYNPEDKTEDLELKMMTWKLKIIKDLPNVRDMSRYI